MDQKSGGIRSIVVGYAWRRLQAKYTSAHAIDALTDYFTPFHLGVGVSRDVRPMCFLSVMPDD